ncbi:hypothetical protein [Rhodococcus sp. 1168]|uniref:glycine-rich domain-containing protein n=1 Tax=Rhodococcus sp. 1168 TaxID=2018041 RepID=UPI00111C3666|nr:hypothetical protein [Rhodococcus sp. 1168]
MQNESEAQIKAAGRAEADAAMGSARGNMITNLFGGLIGGIAQLISMLFAGIFGGGGGLVDLIGGFLGVKNKVNQVADVELPRIDNRIDELAGGVTQFTYGTPGTFTKPAGATRIAVSLVGGAAGGARWRNNPVGGGSGGWTRWYEFLADEVPGSVAIGVGSGGGGATSDDTLGGNGTGSSFGSLLTVGGGKCTTAGPVCGYGTELYYNGSGGRGGNNDGPATNGGNGPFSSGGVVGAGNGAQGGDGISPDAGLIGPGSGGAGGSAKGGTGNGGRGGHGGYPGGGAGAGGNYTTLGTVGNGGNGAPGLVVVRVYFN